MVTGGSTLESGWSPPWLGKKSFLFIKFKNFMIFFTLKKKCVTTLNYFRPNIIKFWTKFSNKLSCKLKLQLHSIFFLLAMNFNNYRIRLHLFFLNPPCL